MGEVNDYNPEYNGPKIRVHVNPTILNNDTTAQAQFEAQAQLQAEVQAQLEAQAQLQAQAQAQLQAQVERILVLLKNKYHL
jgi:hypothetical protein